MKKFCIILSMLLFSIAMSAQEPQVVILNDGTVIKGNIEQLPDGGARVTNEYGDTFEYTSEEIRYIGKELSRRRLQKLQAISSDSQASQPAKRQYFDSMRGYRLFLEGGIGIGGYTSYSSYTTSYGNSYSSYDESYSVVSPLFTVDVINGYSFSQYIYVGGGIGLSYSSSLYIPIYAHARSVFLKTRVSPFAYLSIGGAIDCLDTAYSGLYFDTGVGILIRSSKKHEYWISISGGTESYWAGTRLKFSYAF